MCRTGRRGKHAPSRGDIPSKVAVWGLWQVIGLVRIGGQKETSRGGMRDTGGIQANIHLKALH